MLPRVNKEEQRSQALTDHKENVIAANVLRKNDFAFSFTKKKDSDLLLSQM